MAMMDKATSMLFRTRAAICDWRNYTKASYDLVQSTRQTLAANNCDPFGTTTPAVHPFEALTWPCLSIDDATRIAHTYSKRATIESQEQQEQQQRHQSDYSTNWSDIDSRLSRTEFPFVTVNKDDVDNNGGERDDEKVIKLGYISPDFTSKHPLAFLMQDVFRLHDTESFQLHIYSLGEESDDSSEVSKIYSSTTSTDDNNRWTVLKGSINAMSQTIQNDKLDILIDLCGYTGTSLVANIMSMKVAPIQIAYMGYPASTAAQYIDYMIADEIVIPSELRQYYTESILYMPHCYFVNSHKFLPNMMAATTTSDEEVSNNESPSTAAAAIPRSTYNLPSSPAFVFCCHSRPDKIDPETFSTWIRALKRTREYGKQHSRIDMANACLWLLKSDQIMEDNLRSVISKGFDGYVEEDLQESLIFSDKVPRDEHLHRLSLADVFLDTPSYNAHTVGCDCLSAGVPMISLLQKHSHTRDDDSSFQEQHGGQYFTDKLSSRVGASLLKNVGGQLGSKLVASTMDEYEECMVQCAINDNNWFSPAMERHLLDTRTTSPLFDTERWVKNLEIGLKRMNSLDDLDTDIYIIDND
jgi:protein O-GlcNAc transferase